MKTLIAILSCHALRGWQSAQRDTWIKDIPQGVDHRFFLGRPDLDYIFSDEVFLSAGDTFLDVTEKTVEMCRWALGQGYDFVFKADLDTLVRPAALMASGFEHSDYTGGRNSFFASGGSGYWLSKRAMQCVVKAKIEPGPAEDVHVARVLLDNGIELHADDRYLFYPGSVMDERTLTYHLSSVIDWTAKYNPSMMHLAYTNQNHKPTVIPPEIRFRRLRRNP